MLETVRVINSSRYALEFVIPVEEDGSGGATFFIGAREKLDVSAEEWAPFDECAGVKNYRDKLRWLIVTKKRSKLKKSADVEGIANMPAKAARELVHASTDVAELHEWLEQEKRKDVEVVIKARIAQLAEEASKPNTEA